MSAGDETLIEITYAEPYFVSLPESVGQGNLALLGNSTNLGGLEPAAGPGAKKNTSSSNLGDLEPAAGPGAGQQQAAAGNNDEAACANGFLDDEWRATPEQRNCEVGKKLEQ